MPYFDFENTPINNDITLKAKWCCSGGGQNPYGLWDDDRMLRVTTSSGVYYCSDLTAAIAFVNGTGSSTAPSSGFVDEAGVAKTITPRDVLSIDFGKGFNTNQSLNNFLVDLYFTSLTSITGFHHPLVFGQTFYSGNENSALAPICESTIYFPPNTGLGTFFMWAAVRFCGTIIFDFPPTGISTNSLFLAASRATAPAYQRGIKLGGDYADDWLALFPNSAGPSSYRKLIKA